MLYEVFHLMCNQRCVSDGYAKVETLVDYAWRAYHSYYALKEFAGRGAYVQNSTRLRQRFQQIQNRHREAFFHLHVASFTTFVVSVYALFDNSRNQANFSLEKIQYSQKTKELVEQFRKRYKHELRLVEEARCKHIAHNDLDKADFSFNFDLFDPFVEGLWQLLAQLIRETSEGKCSYVSPDREQYLQDLHLMFDNLYRGEEVRKIEIALNADGRLRNQEV